MMFSRVGKRRNIPGGIAMCKYLKSLILKRQKAFYNHGVASTQYKFYRNIVNRERKVCKANFCKSKIEHTQKENPRVYGGKKLKEYAVRREIQLL
jgi:hypothetical protein